MTVAFAMVALLVLSVAALGGTALFLLVKLLLGTGAPVGRATVQAATSTSTSAES